MRRPHVFERTAPRMGREPFRESQHPSSAARLLAAQIGLANLLESARLEAERAASL